MESLVSVIIPVYKVEKYLDKCVESVVNQTYKNLEIILVDDGSPDKCPIMCDEWGRKDARIVVIHKENGGVSSARNAALDIAKGEYITFVDSDDTVDKTLIATLYSKLIQNEADCSICNMNIVIDDNSMPKKVSDIDLVLNKIEILKEVLSGGITAGYACGKMFKAKHILKNKFAEEIHFGEDELFTIQILLNCDRIVFTEKALYNYFQRECGITQVKNFNEKISTECMAFERIKEIIFQMNCDELNQILYSQQIRRDVALLSKLFFSKMEKSVQTKEFQTSIRKYISMKNLGQLRLITQIEAVLIAINCNVFFCWMKIKACIKYILNK